MRFFVLLLVLAHASLAQAGERWRNLVWDGKRPAKVLGRLFDAKKHRNVRVLWWNIEEGKTNAKLCTANGSADGPLDQNLRRMARSKFAPDVIALGEYKAGALNS